jgi:hypothetical protein
VAACFRCAMMIRLRGSVQDCIGHREAKSGSMRYCAYVARGARTANLQCRLQADRFGREHCFAKGSDCDDVGQ